MPCGQPCSQRPGHDRRRRFSDANPAVVRNVLARLGVSAQALTRGRQRARVDAGLVPGVTSEESAELKRLRRENAELKRANEILRTASAFFAAELDRPTTR